MLPLEGVGIAMDRASLEESYLGRITWALKIPGACSSVPDIAHWVLANSLIQVDLGQ